MIRIQSGYYYCVEDEKKPSNQNKVKQQANENSKNQPLRYQVVGNIKGYITHVAAQVAKIKELKNKQKQEQLANKLILDQLTTSQKSNQSQIISDIRLEIAVPEQIYQLDQRITKLEQKIINDEIVKQKIQRKGKLSQRAKILNTKIQKLQQKSIQSVHNNIQNYCKNLQQKEQQSKSMFLYEAFTKTQSLSQQIQMLDVYLNNLNQILTKFKALPPQSFIVSNHEKIIQKRQKNQENIKRIFKSMVEQYQKVVKEIDSL